MCGIFCYVKYHQQNSQTKKFSQTDLEVIKQYFKKIKHRGPDHTSEEILNTNHFSIFMGFHRLAIIDPSESTNPLLQDDGIYLICNGEIYNYKYLIEKYNLNTKTGSDCEVILQLYRKFGKTNFSKILPELDGVFSFVLYDHHLQNMIVARDRIGVRPLFIGNDDDSVCFSSEAKSLYHNNVSQFPSGYYLDTDFINTNMDEFYSFDLSKVLNMNYITSKNIVKELLIESVRKRLMADRPVGFLVSGGLDSSLVASIASRLLNNPITTFSIGLKNSPDLLAARKVAEHLNSIHHEIIITEKDITDSLEDVIKFDETYDITTIRASIPMYLICKFIRENTDIKVIFFWRRC